MEEKQTITFEVGQRVKFIDPESFDPRIGDGFEVRGRILCKVDPLLQIIIDGKAFAIWVNSSDVKGERE